MHTEAGSAPKPQDAATALQARTLERFTAMYLKRQSWKSALVLSTRLHAEGLALALATLGLGGTFLGIDVDEGSLRAAGRLGATDFTVSTASEALRILKNEIRKGSPVSVGLSLDPQKALQQLLLRGVQPAAVFGASDDSIDIRTFLERGAVLLAAEPEELLPPLEWSLQEDDAPDLRTRRHRDGILRAQVLVGRRMPSRDVNERWLGTVPRLFPRDRTRVYWKKEMAP